jgi:cytochrome c oxidase cbb3-type subunit 2
MFKHEIFEKNTVLLAIGILLTISIGGLVEIVPLFTIENTIEKVQGVRPYSPLEQMGRNIYIREGCYNCHSQMIRPFRDEHERYGHYSLAAESMYDHPFQWGSKRTGPDLARVGGKYSHKWHVDHLLNPPAMVQGSIMPTYRHLTRKLAYSDVAEHLKTLKIVGVPYSDEQIKNAAADLEAQAKGTEGATEKFLARYPKAAIGDFDENSEITEMDALVAYLQILGRMVDITSIKPELVNR